MELTNQINMNKIAFFIALLCLFTNCSKDSYEAFEPTNYNYYYPTDEATITASQIGDGTGKLDPKGIAIANDKLYICNGDVLEVFNAKTFAFIKTIKNYTKGATTIPLTKLSSVSVDNGRIYLGSVDSRLFVIDEKTNLGINTVGNGQWWQTFVHVFGVVVKDGLVFVKEKNTTIKVFETSQITDNSNWNLTPIAELNTLEGYDEIYSMDVASGNLVVAGRNAKSYLYYNIANIRSNATNSLVTPINPTATPFADAKPIAVAFSTDWAVTSEKVGNVNYLRLYPKEEFVNKTYTPRINAADVMGANPFGSIVSTAQLNDRLFLADNTNQKIRIIKLNQTTIAEQK
ncbi:PQQ-like beta-propeller repeat protein [Flavobacterium sp. ZT3R18]|uniref:PQQ-binding-like beta-propeller repeat protein n=1 Tax=Flavobacterium sp. ZT3R18 TaxID=2594429 RepID=UPI00117B6784|nr:PQQ-binding-like beta-propeller repeat protein [Flavobacterium sp. ZT3R18]TRX38939.1 PQQ-like beta-propeller repeat protein [Flavobacterium sp. ZT3R18]